MELYFTTSLASINHGMAHVRPVSKVHVLVFHRLKNKTPVRSPPSAAADVINKNIFHLFHADKPSLASSFFSMHTQGPGLSMKYMIRTVDLVCLQPLA